MAAAIDGVPRCALSSNPVTPWMEAIATYGMTDDEARTWNQGRPPADARWLRNAIGAWRGVLHRNEYRHSNARAALMTPLDHPVRTASDCVGCTCGAIGSRAAWPLDHDVSQVAECGAITR